MSASNSQPSFDDTLKQWAHFPKSFEDSYQKAKEGKFQIMSNLIKLDANDSKSVFFEKVINQMTSYETIDDGKIRKLLKINKNYSLENENLISHIASKSLFKSVDTPTASKKFLLEYLSQTKTFDKNEFVKELKIFIEKSLVNDPVKIYELAKVLALEYPSLLFVALPHLNISKPEERRFLAKLAICTPLSKGLPSSEYKQKLLASIPISEWILCFRVKTPGSDNIRGLLGYLAEQLEKTPEFKPADGAQFPVSVLKFLNFANGVLKYGVVCRAKAIKLGILQVSSLDQNPRPPNEVEVNCIQQSKGIQTALYHNAKGAITITTERFHDPLASKVVTKRVELTHGFFATTHVVTDPEALKELSERTHCCLFIISDPKKLIFKSNDGKPEAANSRTVTGFHSNCVEMKATDGCLEIKVDANIDPQGFSVVVLSDRFKQYENLLNVPPNVVIQFVPTLREKEVNYGFRDASNDAKVAKVVLDIPDFESALRKAADEIRGNVITHISKGKCSYDL